MAAHHQDHTQQFITDVLHMPEDVVRRDFYALMQRALDIEESETRSLEPQTGKPATSVEKNTECYSA